MLPENMNKTLNEYCSKHARNFAPRNAHLSFERQVCIVRRLVSGGTPEGVKVGLEVKLAPSSELPDQWVGWDAPLSAARWWCAAAADPTHGCTTRPRANLHHAQ